MGRKVKYDLSFKLACVKSVIEQGCSVHSISKAKNINSSMLSRWIDSYNLYGKEGLIPRKIHIFATNAKQTVDLKLNYSKISKNTDLNFVYEIPKNAKEIRF